MKSVRSENRVKSGDVCGLVTLPKTNVTAKRHPRNPFIFVALQLWVTFVTFYCNGKVILRVSVYEFYLICVYAFLYIEFCKKVKRHVIMSPTNSKEVDYAR